MAMEAYVQAIDSGTSAERKEEIERELKAYCALDTEAMVRIGSFVEGVAPFRLGRVRLNRDDH